MGYFQIDGVDMPKPSSWTTKPNILTAESERLVGNGKLVAPYLTTIWETTWTYKLLSQEDYDKLYDAYITSCIRNKNLEHDFSTLDSNTGKQLRYRMYTQNDFNAPLYRIHNGKRIYKDISFTFVGVGGEE